MRIFSRQANFVVQSNLGDFLYFGQKRCEVAILYQSWVGDNHAKSQPSATSEVERFGWRLYYSSPICQGRRDVGPSGRRESLPPRAIGQRVEGWLSLFDDPILGNSAQDRLANASHQIVIEGDSYRERLSPHRKLLGDKEQAKAEALAASLIAAD